MRSSKQPTREMMAFAVGIDTYTFISCKFLLNASCGCNATDMSKLFRCTEFRNKENATM